MSGGGEDLFEVDEDNRMRRNNWGKKRISVACLKNLKRVNIKRSHYRGYIRLVYMQNNADHRNNIS